MTGAHVDTVAASAAHTFSKQPVPAIELVAGIGVSGDAHAGETVKHRSRVARDPSQPNLRQVHLIHGELLDALTARGFDVAPAALGENLTSRGIDLLALSTGTVLLLGTAAAVEVTGLRNPCRQLDAYRSGLMQAVLDRDAEGRLLRLAGVMAVVRTGGTVRPGDAIEARPPDGPYRPLEPV
ncbi:MOSC domain-containing protein [Rhodovibrio sodomensis]|uniref:MOSC domain-containing protein n=1 Tax=Rhodovibrio sodomensis TaxID=1088 RepID=A0ABS1DKF7_9PROT|nr:MOSC domain-containing protein [Rhodovibrio sodomensis]MBK1670694.1 MOSC domain-containing protein [Rhodovibrio sodomensis]